MLLPWPSDSKTIQPISASNVQLKASESFFARCMVVNAAQAAGIQPIDSVFSDIDDMEALAGNVKESKSLGFTGMGCIHPRQVPVIHENFLPDDTEMRKGQENCTGL